MAKKLRYISPLSQSLQTHSTRCDPEAEASQAFVLVAADSFE